MTSTRTRAQNYTILGVIATFMMGGGGTVLVWGADQRYAQKADIEALGDIVEENSKAQLATISSVDVLLVQILDIRLEDLELEIRELEGQAELTVAEESLLATDRRELADLQVERGLTLGRVLARRTQ